MKLADGSSPAREAEAEEGDKREMFLGDGSVVFARQKRARFIILLTECDTCGAYGWLKGSNGEKSGNRI